MLKTQRKLTIFYGLLLTSVLGLASCSTQKKLISHEQQPHITEVQNWQHLKLNGYRIGPEDAPVQIVEFLDYRCRYCKQIEPALKVIRHKYSKKVAVIFENYPVGDHAFKTAVAAECVHRYAPEEFMAFHDLLFALQDRLGALSYSGLVAQIGLPETTSIQKCIENQATAPIIKKSMELGKKLNVLGVPALIVNNMLVMGSLTEQQLDSLVQTALKRSSQLDI